jgi:hypothetical protein
VIGEGEIETYKKVSDSCNSTSLSDGRDENTIHKQSSPDTIAGGVHQEPIYLPAVIVFKGSSPTGNQGNGTTTYRALYVLSEEEAPANPLVLRTGQ